MAVYVASDIHGYLAAFKEALELSGFGPDDELYVLGDLIDRGPDPVGTIQYVRSLPNAHVLMGNHEQLMLQALSHLPAPENGYFDLGTMSDDDFLDWYSWCQNGGGTTIDQLEKLTVDDYLSLVAWVRNLPFYDVVEVAGRPYILVHAGIDPASVRAWVKAYDNVDVCDIQTLKELLAHQNTETLVWIREDFWNFHTGLIDAEGRGPVVIAGHTPSISLMLCTSEQAQFTTPEGKGTVVPLGADASTAGVADRIDIDCSAAAGEPNGRVGVMRLDDGALFFADVSEKA